MKNLRMQVAGSTLRWPGHTQRKSEDRLTERARKTGEGGRKRKGGPKLTRKEISKGQPRVGENRRRSRWMEIN